MADNIIFFDKYQYLKRSLPGFGTPSFANAYAEARAFVHVAEGRFLSHAQLTHLATRFTPLASLIVQVMVAELARPSDKTDRS